MAATNRSGETGVGAFTRRMEEQAYTGYREWPIFLALREAQLKQLLTVPPALPLPPIAASADEKPPKGAKPA
jgi:hypothetical protein